MRRILRARPDTVDLFTSLDAVNLRSEENLMGRFVYSRMSPSVEIDDRTLAHVRIVVMNKLRRRESFMFDTQAGDGSGRRSYWINAGVPIQFHFYGTRTHRINRHWIDVLLASAGGADGMRVLAEPAD